MAGPMIAVALAALLALGGTAGSGVGSAVGTPTDPVPDVPVAHPPTVTMTTMNWGRPVSLVDADAPAWAHLTGVSTTTEVVATVALNGLSLHEWEMDLTAPDSFGGPESKHCQGEELVSPDTLVCHFQLAVSAGPNRLDLAVSADGREIVSYDHAVITGGAMNWDVGYEVLDATGSWVAVPHDQPVTLPATTQSALRYLVVNTGTVPLRLTSGCSDRILPAGRSVTCPLRGVRPAQSLAGEYRTPIRLEDAAGGGASFDIRTGVRTFAGTFSLGAPSVTVGQVVVVDAAGLPKDGPFALQFRIDDESVIVGTSITRTGHTRLSFPLPSTSIGSARVDVVHDGLTIASLPFDVTLVPRDPEAPAPVWPWLLLAVVLLAVVLLAVALARRRVVRARRAADDVTAAADADPPASGPGSPAPRPTDPYRDATPARREPAAARRR